MRSCLRFDAGPVPTSLELISTHSHKLLSFEVGPRGPTGSEVLTRSDVYEYDMQACIFVAMLTWTNEMYNKIYNYSFTYLLLLH